MVERDEKRKKVGVLTGKQPLIQVRKPKEIKKPTVSGENHHPIKTESLFKIDLTQAAVLKKRNLRRQSCSSSFCPW